MSVKVIEEILISPFVVNREQHRANCRAAINVSIKELKNLIVDGMIYGQHTGRVYRRGAGAGFTRSHQASKEGETPAPDTLRLVRSVKDELLTDNVGEVRVEELYGTILERRRNRPFFRGVCVNYQSQFTANVAKFTSTVT